MAESSKVRSQKKKRMHTISSLTPIFHQISSLEQKIARIRLQSHKRRHLRRTKIDNQHKFSNKQDLDYKQSTETQPEPKSTNFKHESMNGLIFQFPQNKEIHATISNSYLNSNSSYYISQVVKNYKDSKSLAREHLHNSLQILKSLQQAKSPSNTEIMPKILNLNQQNPELKTIVFDLDQTLIHCCDDIKSDHDLMIDITFPNGETAKAAINIRPGVQQLLQSLKGKFEVIVFTASHSCYANQILNYLDPLGELIQHRLYREHCILSAQGYFVKDLRVIGRSLKNVLLVDNAAYSYAYQLDNGVPILPYYKGKQDYQLDALRNYLLGLVDQQDLRKPNRKYFKLNLYLEFYGEIDNLVGELYNG